MISIAQAPAQTNQYDLRNYVCKGAFFFGNTTNLHFTNKWAVYFQPVPLTRDYDLVVTVDDSTGKAELHYR